MTILNEFSFEVTGTEEITWGDGVREVGTVEATLGRQTKRVSAVRYKDGRIVSWDFTGRYMTGKKAWPATVSVDHGREFVWYGRDERVRRCTKSGLSFAN